MMIEFYKYQGTGNDFIIIDNRDKLFKSSNYKLIESLCNRRFGIGADGLMLLEDHNELDFTMRYFNSDGKEASMCGNGGRCIAAFAVKLGVVSSADNFSFMAVDGRHDASYQDDIVSLHMSDVKEIDRYDTHTFLNTGSPHHVEFHDSVDSIDVVSKGRLIRHSDLYQPDGTNVNFVHFTKNNKIKVRTYERGVEDETFACGTGVVASAISAHIIKPEFKDFEIEVLGGQLNVHFEPQNDSSYTNIWLKGPATFVYKGKIEL